MSLIEELVNLIAPNECVSCNREGSLLCTDCVQQLPSVTGRCYRCRRVSEGGRTCTACRRASPLFAVHTISEYEGAAKRLVYGLKFERARAAADTIAQIMAAEFDLPPNLLLTYVPTANTRVRMRGYDQAALIAQAFARRRHVPCTTLLARTGVQRQVGQQRNVRTEQMKSAFRPVKSSMLQGKHILLIDDVLTTGATCEAAGRVLRQAGAVRVSAAVFAVA